MPSFLPKDKRIRLNISNTKMKRLGDSKRQTFEVSVNLTEPHDTLNGMAEWIQNACGLMQRTANKSKTLMFEEVINNMAIEVFATPKGRRVFPIITDATVSKFELGRNGKNDETAEVILYFNIEFTGRKEIHDWTWDHKGMACYATFEQQQRELTLDAAPNGQGVDDDEEERDDDEDEVEDDEGDFEDDDDE